MAYKKQDWKPFDESLSMEENAIRGGIVTAERANYIENGIEEIDKELASAAIKLGKVVTENDLQNYLAGKTNIRGYSNGSVTDISGTDLNNLFESGTFKGNNMTNAPDSGWWFIQNLYHTKTYEFQIAWHLEKSTDLNPQVRAMGVGRWGTWRSLATIADLQSVLSGGDIVINGMCDFKNKIVGSVVENPHIIRRTADTVIIDPSVKRGEPTQSEVDRIKDLDSALYVITNKTKDNIVQAIASFDLIADIDRRFPKLFELHSAVTQLQKTDVVRKLITDMTYNVHGFATGPASNALSTAPSSTNGWGGIKVTKSDAMHNNSRSFNGSQINAIVQDDGCFYVIIFAPACDGVTPSVVNLDYVSLEYTLAIKMSDVYVAKAEYNALESRVSALESKVK